MTNGDVLMVAYINMHVFLQISWFFFVCIATASAAKGFCWLLVCVARRTLTGRLGDTFTQARRLPGGHKATVCQSLEAQP